MMLFRLPIFCLLIPLYTNALPARAQTYEFKFAQTTNKQNRWNTWSISFSCATYSDATLLEEMLSVYIDLDTFNGTNLSGRVICSAKLLTSQAWIMVQGNFGSKHIKCLHWMNGTKQLLIDVPLLYLPPHRLINGSGTLSAAISWILKPISDFMKAYFLNGVFFIPKYLTMHCNKEDVTK